MPAGRPSCPYSAVNQISLPAPVTRNVFLRLSSYLLSSDDIVLSWRRPRVDRKKHHAARCSCDSRRSSNVNDTVENKENNATVTTLVCCTCKRLRDNNKTFEFIPSIKKPSKTSLFCWNAQSPHSTLSLQVSNLRTSHLLWWSISVTIPPFFMNIIQLAYIPLF